MKKTITVRIDENLLKAVDDLVYECILVSSYTSDDPLCLISNRSQLIERAIVELINKVTEVERS